VRYAVYMDIATDSGAPQLAGGGHKRHHQPTVMPNPTRTYHPSLLSLNPALQSVALHLQFVGRQSHQATASWRLRTHMSRQLRVRMNQGSFGARRLARTFPGQRAERRRTREPSRACSGFILVGHKDHTPVDGSGTRKLSESHRVLSWQAACRLCMAAC
jgi:hypothetical protein